MKPLARSEDLLVEELPDELLVYDLKRHHAHCLNQVAALVWRGCDGKSTIAGLSARVGRELGQPVDEAAVWVALDALEKAKLLAPSTAPSGRSRISRRKMLVGLAVVPAVLTILAPRAAQAASGVCKHAGAVCVNSGQCCSGNCSAAAHRCVGG